MGKRSEYAPGTFSWVDLGCADRDGAKQFYGGLFGWAFDDQPTGQGGTYTMARLDGADVAAMYDRRDAETPPHWDSYVTVESADETAARARQLGGTLVMEPFDVLEIGRMAVIQDPTGAVLAVWEPRGRIGAGIVNEPGALTWNDLQTADPQAAIDFYSGLFGWTTESMPTGGSAYHVIRNGDRTNGGIMEAQSEAPPAWVPYFAVEDVAEAERRAEELGARLLAGPMEVPAGTFAVLQDPPGAVFAIFAGEFDD